MQIHYEKPEECLGIVKNPEGEYKSVGIPQQKNIKEGIFNSTVVLTDMASPGDQEQVKLKIEKDYFFNSRIDHFSTITQEGKLIFGAITKTVDSNTLDMQISVEDGKMRIFSDTWTVQYPIIAYKMINSNEIAIINTLQPKSAQIQLNLGQIQLLSFVNGPQLVSKRTSVLSSFAEIQSNTSKARLQMLVEYKR